MRVSDIQRRRTEPAELQSVPVRRTLAWLGVALLIAVGVYLFFRHARDLAPLLA